MFNRQEKFGLYFIIDSLQILELLVALNRATLKSRFRQPQQPVETGDKYASGRESVQEFRSEFYSHVP